MILVRYIYGSQVILGNGIEVCKDSFIPLIKATQHQERHPNSSNRTLPNSFSSSKSQIHQLPKEPQGKGMGKRRKKSSKEKGSYLLINSRSGDFSGTEHSLQRLQGLSSHA
jgi:hypothetical protein